MDNLCKLQYRDEHFSCLYYGKEETQRISYGILESGKFIEVNTENSNVLVFVIEGSILVHAGQKETRKVESGMLFFLESNIDVFLKAEQCTKLMWCRLEDAMTLCNAYSIKNLTDWRKIHRKSVVVKPNEQVALPIVCFLKEEVVLTAKMIQEGMLCLHFQHLKINLFMLELRAFYSKQDLCRLFLPILNEEGEFRQEVIRAYEDSMNAQELMYKLDLPETTFNRKFRKAFGMSAGQYLIRKKRSKILREILMSDIPIKELSEKYNFTPNYVVRFCKTHFGKTPSQLRENRFL